MAKKTADKRAAERELQKLNSYDREEMVRTFFLFFLVRTFVSFIFFYFFFFSQYFTMKLYNVHSVLTLLRNIIYFHSFSTGAKTTTSTFT